MRVLSHSVRLANAFVTLFAIGQAAACGGGLPSEEARLAEPVVYGTDDRVEVFEAPPLGLLAARSTAAFIPRAKLERDVRLAADVPTAAEEHGTCGDGRFDQQPSVAFCTGVLVERDLVLTAGHCLRSFALSDFAIVFGYELAGADGALSPIEVARPIEIVDERLDAASVTPRLDHAWVRLDRRISPRFSPASLALTPPTVGAPLLIVSAAQGAPLKVDGGSDVRAVDPAAADYFLANSDTFHGSSGAGAFDAAGALLGILARGESDYVVEGGVSCGRPNTLTDDAAAEQYSRTDAARASLCARSADASSLCRSDCGPRCAALEPEAAETAPADTGCALGPPPRGARHGYLPLLLLLTFRRFARKTLESSRQRCHIARPSRALSS